MKVSNHIISQFYPFHNEDRTISSLKSELNQFKAARIVSTDPTHIFTKIYFGFHGIVFRICGIPVANKIPKDFTVSNPLLNYRLVLWTCNTVIVLRQHDTLNNFIAQNLQLIFYEIMDNLVYEYRLVINFFY